MYISYSRDYRKNYLIIQDDRVLEGDYRLKMLTQNRIEGLLDCQERMLNGEGLIYYDVTSKQTMKNCFELRKIGKKEIINLFSALERVSEGLQRYILDEGGLVLKPDFIFMNIDKDNYDFLYYPYYENADENQLAHISEFLLSKVNEDDTKAVEIVYQLADIINRQHFSLSETLLWFNHEFGERIAEKPKVEEEVSIDTIVPEPLEEPIEKEERQSFFTWLKELIFGKKEEEDNEYFEVPSYDFNEIKKAMTEETPKAESEGTVFIPWIEDNENKLYGMGKGNKYHIDLAKCPIIVGKLRGSVDMVLDDSSVSRMHAKFLRDGNRYFMMDLNSTNGSFRNGIRLNPNESVQIEAGDEIGLGKLKFIYR